MMDIKIKGLAHVGIPTSDLEASRKFYESLGFRTLVYAPELEGNNFLFMECNGEIIGLPQSLDADARALAGTKGAGDIDHFALYVDDIEATCEELKCRGCRHGWHRVYGGLGAWVLPLHDDSRAGPREDRICGDEETALRKWRAALQIRKSLGCLAVQGVRGFPQQS